MQCFGFCFISINSLSGGIGSDMRNRGDTVDLKGDGADFAPLRFAGTVFVTPSLCLITFALFAVFFVLVLSVPNFVLS